MKPFQEGEMGWGLKTAEFVAKGTLVIEYLGDVINDEEMRVYKIYLYFIIIMFVFKNNRINF